MSATPDSSGPDFGYATVTVLTFANEQGQQAAMTDLTELIRQARDLPGLQRAWLLDTGPPEAVMVTLFTSQVAAEQAGASVRPHLGAAVGPHVTGPPQCWKGQVIASRDSSQ